MQTNSPRAAHVRGRPGLVAGPVNVRTPCRKGICTEADTWARRRDAKGKPAADASTVTASSQQTALALAAVEREAQQQHITSRGRIAVRSHQRSEKKIQSHNCLFWSHSTLPSLPLSKPILLWNCWTFLFFLDRVCFCLIDFVSGISVIF